MAISPDVISSFIACYLTAGFIWCVWNSNSRIFTAIAGKVYEDGNIIWLVAAFALGSLIWPIGLVANIIDWIARFRRDGGEL